ncbi:hypothetical protein AcV7_000223 [Taiwanofungus camphoratus]|nr:hypothetical protein AcV7_000223 [Antrodia cinnamomea]
MTIQHIVLGKLKPASALPAPTEEIYAIARTMLASVPGVTNLHIGALLSTPATFNQGAYLGHPIHVEFQTKYSSALQDMIAYQLSSEPSKL